MNGNSALSLTDIPFVYSLANLLLIYYTGNFEIERFVILGFLAGMFGTFLVFWHPIQGIIDKFSLISKNKSKYTIRNPGAKTAKLEIKIDESLFRLSLNTHAIKYQKDKFAGLIYFMIILLTIAIVSTSDNFKQAVMVPAFFQLLIMFGPVVMMFGCGWLLAIHGKKLINNLKLNSLYFLLSNDIIGYGNESNLIKTAVDLNDWATAQEIIDKQIRNHWENMKRYSEV